MQNIEHARQAQIVLYAILVPTCNFQDLNTFNNENHVIVLINTTRWLFMSFIGLWVNTDENNSPHHAYVNHLLILKAFAFVRTKYLFTFQVWDFYCEGRVRSIVVNCFSKLFQVNILSFSMQEKLVHVRSLYGTTTFLEFVVQC